MMWRLLWAKRLRVQDGDFVVLTAGNNVQPPMLEHLGRQLRSALGQAGLQRCFGVVLGGHMSLASLNDADLARIGLQRIPPAVAAPQGDK